MKIDSTARLILWVVALTSAIQVKCSTLNGNGGHIKRSTCDSSQLYRDLMALRDTQNCAVEKQVWGMLDRLNHETNGTYCTKQAVIHLNEHFKDSRDTPGYCNCSGMIHHHYYPHVPDFGEHNHDCGNDNSFQQIFLLYFGHHWERYQNCGSHHRVWQRLASVGSDLCRNEIVRHVAVVTSRDQCSCQKNEAGPAVQQMNHTTNQAANSDPCFQYESYKYLYDLSLHVDRCVSVNSMWHYLADLQHRNVDCRKKIMDHMNGIFHGQETSLNCHCTGHDTHHNIIRLPDLDQDYCNTKHEQYQLLHNEIYAHSPSPCRSHQYLWQRLLNIPRVHGERDCRADLILHAAATYPDPRHDPCHCLQVTAAATSTIINVPSTKTSPYTTQGTTDILIVTVAATSTSTNVPSTKTSPYTTQGATDILPGLHACNRALAISEIAHNVTHAHPNASDCITGDHKSSEALVFVSCNTSSTATWRQGENVMALCHRIPLFTPIATFRIDGVYTPTGGTAGIFLGCLPNGFKFAVQDCHSGIQIKHLLTGGALGNNPSNYFVVRW